MANMQPRRRLQSEGFLLAYETQAILLNPIIQFNSLNKLYLLMENIHVIYDFFV